MLGALTVVAVIKVAAVWCSAVLGLPSTPVACVAAIAQRRAYKAVGVAVVPHGRAHGHAARAHELRGRRPVLPADAIDAVAFARQFAVIDHGVRVAASRAVDDSCTDVLAKVGHHSVPNPLEPACGILAMVRS